jgi:DNA-binding PadR family transcriptional regulator
VYPALAQLEDEGLIRSTERDGAKLFEITDAGRRQLEERESESAPWDLDDDPESGAIFEVRKLVGDLAAAAMQVARAGDESQQSRAAETLKEARRALYRILADDTEK